MGKRKIYIDYLKMFAIALVVLQHSNAYYVENAVGNADFFQLVRMICSIINVPAFVFCAGYLCRKKPIWRYYSNRFNRIVIPFWTFTSLKLVYTHFISDKYAHGTSFGEQWFNSYIIGDTYWFCYAIMLICLCAPLLWKRNSARGVNIKGLVLGVGCIAFPLIAQSYNLEIINVFQIINAIYYFPFFLFGYIVKEYDDSLDLFVDKIGRKCYLICLSVIFMLCMVMYLTEIVEWGSLYMRFLTAMSIVLFTKEILKNATTENVIVLFLSKYSLQIMLLDAFYKEVLFSLICRIIPLSLITVLLVWALDISLCLLTCMALERIPYIRKTVGL